MSLFSAFEDFVHYTFAALPGLWGKLIYLAGLRRSDGEYDHWGMRRLHGDKAMQRAVGRAHQTVFLDILRTPLRELQDDAARSAVDAEVDEANYLRKLEEGKEAMLPKYPGGGSSRHFNSVLRALSMLAHSRKDPTPPDA